MQMDIIAVVLKVYQTLCLSSQVGAINQDVWPQQRGELCSRFILFAHISITVILCEAL